MADATTTETEFAQQQKLVADDGGDGDWFGDFVTVSGDGTTALISARKDEDPNGESAGSAYIFSRNDDEWTQEQKLTASDGDSQDQFGSSVALSEDGTTALIGALRDDEPNGTNKGSAYVFTQNSGQWTQQQKLAPDDGEGGDFGDSVSLSRDGSTALIGARFASVGGEVAAGAAYVFTRSNDQWTQQQKLSASDSDGDDWFGGSVSLSGDGTAALIGAYNDEEPNGTEAGAAYIFSRSTDQWTQQQKLTPDDGDNGDQFGIDSSLSNDGTTALIGAVRNEDPNGESAGSAYVFTQNNGQWTQQEKLVPNDGDSWDRFGGRGSLSSDGATALIAAHTDEDPNGESAGSTYMFTQNNGQWTQQEKIVPDDGDNGDKFGIGLSLSSDGRTALIGARKDEDPNGDAAGSAYVFASGDSDDGNTGEDDGGTGSVSADEYAVNGEFTAQSVFEAVADWRNDEINATVVFEVISRWRGN